LSRPIDTSRANAIAQKGFHVSVPPLGRAFFRIGLAVRSWSRFFLTRGRPAFVLSSEAG
jgi:hypothetical protein